MYERDMNSPHQETLSGCQMTLLCAAHILEATDYCSCDEFVHCKVPWNLSGAGYTVLGHVVSWWPTL